jgi:hypothetical protein
LLYLSTRDIHAPRVPHRRSVGRTGLGSRGDAIANSTGVWARFCKPWTI